jgi:prevent-host-death family protein
MREQVPTTQAIRISDFKNRLARLVNQVYRQEIRVLIEKNGTPVAALVSVEDMQRLARLDRQVAERKRVVAAMREPFRGVSPEEIERETAKAVAEVQEEMRAEREVAAAARR